MTRLNNIKEEYFTTVMMTRILLVISGSTVLGFGIGVALLPKLGSDPLSLFYLVVSEISGTSMSKTIVLSSAIMLILSLLNSKKSLGVGTIINPLLVGVSIRLVPDILIQGSILIKIIVLLLGFGLIALGTAIYLHGSFGMAPYDSLIIAIARTVNSNYLLGKMILDSTFILLSIIYFKQFSITPFISLVVIGPLIGYFSKVLNNMKIT